MFSNGSGDAGGDSVTARQDGDTPMHASNVEGHFDGFEDGHLIGWARFAGEPISITALIDGQELEEARSDLRREDLYLGGYGDCAFAIPVPAKYLDGKAHNVELQLSEIGLTILNSPQILFFLEEASVGMVVPDVSESASGSSSEVYGEPGDANTSPAEDGVDADDDLLVSKIRQLFDPNFYLKEYPDVKAAERDPFDHFLRSGLKENRSPNVWFDADWYCAANHVSENGFQHYLEVGISYGSVPLLELGDAFTRTETNEFDLNSFLMLSDATKGLPKGAELTRRILRFICQSFDALYYNFLTGNADNPSVCELLAHYFSKGIRDGLPFNRAFNVEYYSERAEIPFHPDPVIRTFRAVSHWLEFGAEAGLIASPAFDQDYYLKVNRDIADAGIPVFPHYLKFGVFEGRRINPMPPIPVVIKGGENWGFGSVQLQAHQLEGFANGAPSFVANVRDAVSSAEFGEVMEKARAFEPEIQDLDECDAFLVAPYHGMHSFALEKICKRLPRRQYDHIICLPWMRMGGADLIGALLRKHLSALDEDASILVILTDSPIKDWKSWFPPGIDVLDLSDYTLSNMDRKGVEYIFFVLLRALSPSHIFNLNSRLCFDVFERFGKRLSSSAKTFNYYFCWDQTEKGRRVGYPSMYFPHTIAHTTGAITDSSFLRDELISMYRLPNELKKKIHVLHTPLHGTWTRGEDDPVPAPREHRRRPLFLWAGRLDRQKRFDLVCRIAEKMPDVDFWCWGAAVLDTGVPLPSMPNNLLLKKPYSSYTELPMEAATGWLYTSGWDGMPTLIIEIASRGIPMVASDVGGIHELIDKSTGWPVDGEAEAKEYVNAIREIVSNPGIAKEKATKLQRRARRKYSVDQYQKTLRSILES